jgi:hypothetical protein
MNRTVSRRKLGCYLSYPGSRIPRIQATVGCRSHDDAMRDTQDGPIQDGSDDASNEDKVTGIVEQVRSDIRHGHTHESTEELLAQRFRETGVEVSEERLRQIAQELSPPQ